MTDFTAPVGGIATYERTEMTRGEIREVESRAGVESIEALQNERRRILPDYAKLAAKFKGGNSASADTKRKQHRALVSKRILANWPKDQKEPSETALERMANSDVEHIEFCEKLERDFIEYTLLDYKLTEIQERIRSRETELMVYNAELRLSR